jgi:hydrogenase nickel incorporation protein HypA/HybF
MHELALTRSLVEIVLDEARRRGFHKVLVVRVRLGVLSHVSPEALAFCFDATTQGTCAEGARLDIVLRPAQAWCVDCGETVAVVDRIHPCIKCGGYNLSQLAGDELRIQDLEVE